MTYIPQMKPTRIDFTIADGNVLIQKLDDETVMARAIPVEQTQKPAAQLDTMLAWCESHGWHVRRYLPLGARAWKGDAPRVVRTEYRIKKKRAQLTRQQIPGLNVHALDLRYDC